MTSTEIVRDFFTCCKSATWDRRLYFPSEGRHADDFLARKIRWLQPGLNPRTRVPETSMLTTRPSKPLEIDLFSVKFVFWTQQKFGVHKLENVEIGVCLYGCHNVCGGLGSLAGISTG
jgi:hypothetical protein